MGAMKVKIKNDHMRNEVRMWRCYVIFCWLRSHPFILGVNAIERKRQDLKSEGEKIEKRTLSQSM